MATAQDAQNFGYSLAFFQTNPELASLLQRATDQNYTTERFTAELRNTGWFRSHGENERKYQALASNDPQTLKLMTDTSGTRVLNLASTLGATLSTQQAISLGGQAIRFGWSDDQIKNLLSPYVKASSSGLYTGAVGQFRNSVQQMSAQYGVAVSASTLGSWTQAFMADRGTRMDENSVKQYMINQAASRYPSFAARLKSGETMQSIADPYIQSYAKILEVPPNRVRLDDHLIQGALATKDAKGAPASKTVWQFEQDLRNDPRWGKTQNAQDQMSNTASTILKSFGAIS